jgi:hypothetical protein
MDELLDGGAVDAWQALSESIQTNWVWIAGLVVGTLFFSRLSSSGGLLQRLVGLVGLALLAWSLWRYAWKLLGGQDGGGDGLFLE